MQIGNLKPCPNLKNVLSKIENFILAHQGIDAFDEIVKLLIVKIYDERVNLKLFPWKLISIKQKKPKCRIYDSKSETYKKIQDILISAIIKWPGIFPVKTRIQIKSEILIKCIKEIQSYSLTNSGLDSLGEAFESLINPRIKGEKGQYFTPPHFVRMGIQMMNPDSSDKILDPACGSGAFLIEAVKHIINKSSKELSQEKISNYVQQKIFGIDFDSRLVKIAKTYMIIFGSNDNNIHLLDTLNEKSWSKQDINMISDFDIIITNPPFAGRIFDNEILSQFELSQRYYQKKGHSKRVTREVLFLERCISLLRDGGKLGIVLPHGITNNRTSKYIRDFLMKKGQIIAVISFDNNMFRPYTSAKTCFLIFKKTSNIDKNKEIFLADLECSGKNSKGDYIFSEKGERGELKLIRNGKEYYIDSDIYEVVKEFWRYVNG